METLVRPSTDIDTTVLDSLDFEPCCMTRTADCDEPAEWFTIAACCGDDLLKCAVHFKRNEQYYAGGSISESRCLACKKHFEPGTTMADRYVRIQRLK
jgi:hypothetical protein